MNELIEQVRQGYDAYRAEYRRSPGVKDLADYLNLTLSETAGALETLEKMGVLKRWPGIDALKPELPQ